MKPRRSDNPFTNRVLIGAMVVLVLIVAVVLAYNANNGLPFVPSYDINVRVPDAAGLIKGDGVTIGGDRVGYVSGITATRTSTGRDIAVLHLKLERSIAPLPADSTDLVRPVSPLGLKYLEITRGRGSRMLPADGSLPLSATHKPVEIDDLFNIFNARTRHAEQTSLFNVGGGFAGRGAELNAALAGLDPLVRRVLPVMSRLLAPSTHLRALFPSLEQAAHEVLPVAARQAHLFTALDETFTPLSSQSAALKAAIAGGPPALRTATRQLPAQARIENDTATFFKRYRATFAALGTASDSLGPAAQAGVTGLRSAPAFNARLDTTVGALGRFATDPRTLPGLEILAETARLLKPTIAYIEPAQTRCNYLTLFFANLENSLSESDSVGSMLGVLAVTLPQVAGSEAGPAATPADGPSAATLVKTEHLNPIQASLVRDSYLHSDPYPLTAAPGQGDECEAGNEIYAKGKLTIGNTAVSQKTTLKTKRALG
ncbi:MAG TPA: MlaD family protein [Solirubrobacteraceae bacterium]|nr:MlaD family protein [Solirubrobacteraceae bacterium]